MTTFENALDMEGIRKSLGVERISYYGFSYGTYLGAVYATSFPKRLDRLVLDSNVDPREVWYESVFSQDLAFEKNAKAWFRWLAKYHQRYQLGKTAATVERTYYADLAKLPADPKPGKLGQNEWMDVFPSGLYSPDSWDAFGGMWQAYLKRRDPRGIIEQLALESENTRAANLAVTCTDAPWPKLGTLLADTRATYRKARFVTWANTWESAPCAYWPAKAERPVRIDGSEVPGALLIDQTHDGPTPSQGSLRLRRLFPEASLVAVPGGTAHAESLNGPPCVRRQVAAYLGSGRLPDRVSGNRADVSCPAAPLPKPVR